MDGWEACVCACVCVCVSVCAHESVQGGLTSAHMPASVLTCMLVFLSVCFSSVRTCWRVLSFFVRCAWVRAYIYPYVCVPVHVHVCVCVCVCVCVLQRTRANARLDARPVLLCSGPDQTHACCTGLMNTNRRRRRKGGENI